MTAVPIDLDRRFRDAAADAGLLDAAYDLVDSPVGPLLVAASERGVCRISFDADPEREIDRLAAAVGTRVLRSPRRLDEARRELEEYFDGARTAFALRVDLALAGAFQRAVLQELARVPYGETTTYGSLAAKVGNPRAARAVGGAMNRNPIPIVLPCHRVVGSSGALVGYGGGLERKRALLELEGAALAR
ncbi:MAG: methylated-DNA--[protein]-cysteine S-methyltransferase [Actinobacteria bacterium]|nr:methylated-DNA--[protein]-cysteine S-methyltransferase [Actinomycetota bacterium]